MIKLNKLTIKIVLLVVFTLGFVTVGWGQVPSNITVTPSSTVASATAVSYTINFTSSLQIGKGSNIDITYPAGTAGTAGTGNVTINGSNAKINSFTNTGGTTWRIALRNPNGNDVPGGPITIVVSGITNPSTIGSDKTINIVLPGGNANSSNYTITSNTAVTVGTVTLGDATASSISSYTIATTLTASHLATNQLVVTFPTGTVLPVSMSTAHVTIGGNAVTAVTTNPVTRVATLTIGTAFTTGNIVFSTDAGVKNPASSGSKTLTVSSNLQPTAGTSTSYTVNNASSLTAASVINEPTTINSISQYTVGFALGNSGALTAEIGTVTVKFPVGTNVPSSISTNAVTVNGVNAFAVETDVNERTVTITTPSALANNASVTLVLKSGAVVLNPFDAGNYTVEVRTSSETSYVESSTYEITPSSVTSASVTLGNIATSGVSTYQLEFSLGAAGGLTANSSSFTVLFPTGTTLTETSITSSTILVNGNAVTASPTVDAGARTISFISPVNISNSAFVTLIFNAGITNPTTSGNYTAQIKTSVEDQYVTSQSYTVSANASSVTNVSFTRTGTNNTQVNATAITYAVTFTPTTAVGNNVQGTITIEFPSQFSLGSVNTGTNVSQTGITGTVTYSKTGTNLVVNFSRNGGNSITGGTPVTITIANVINPTLAKTNHRIGVSVHRQMQMS